MDTEANNKIIGIITFHRAINYGAILQTYALQKKIKELGVKCVIIDYRNKKLENRHKKIKFSDCKNMKDFIRYLLLSKNHNIKYDKFREFANKHFEVSTPFYSLKDLREAEKKYDTFITGSDQVWNYQINDMDAAYFLEFTKDKSKKASYAASFGVSNIPNEYKQKYFELLNDFEYILVREKQGADIIRELLSREAQVVLDPTLLLSKEEWHSVAKEGYSAVDGKYILIYAFGGSKNIWNLAENISKKTGYKIVCIANTYKKSINIKYIKSAGPEEFLGLFKNAEYVITNSFHGTAFSINFNKQFFTEMLPDTMGVNSRIEDILDLFRLDNRIITSSDASVIDILINYNEMNEILETERKKSMALLKNLIEQ